MSLLLPCLNSPTTITRTPGSSSRALVCSRRLARSARPAVAASAPRSRTASAIAGACGAAQLRGAPHLAGFAIRLAVWSRSANANSSVRPVSGNVLPVHGGRGRGGLHPPRRDGSAPIRTADRSRGCRRHHGVAAVVAPDQAESTSQSDAFTFSISAEKRLVAAGSANGSRSSPRARRTRRPSCRRLRRHVIERQVVLPARCARWTSLMPSAGAVNSSVHPSAAGRGVPDRPWGRPGMTCRRPRSRGLRVAERAQDFRRSHRHPRRCHRVVRRVVLERVVRPPSCPRGPR